MPIFHPQQAYSIALSYEGHSHFFESLKLFLKMASEHLNNFDRNAAFIYDEIQELLEDATLQNDTKSFELFPLEKLDLSSDAEFNIYDQISNMLDYSKDKEKIFRIISNGILPSCLKYDFQNDEQRQAIIQKNDAIFNPVDLYFSAIYVDDLLKLYVSSKNLAVFVLKLNIDKNPTFGSIFKLKLFSLIFQAAGIPTVLIINDTFDKIQHSMNHFFVDRIVNPDHFSEIHIFTNLGELHLDVDALYVMAKSLKKAYIYMYIHFFSHNDLGKHKQILEQSQTSHLQFYFLSKEQKEIFGSYRAYDEVSSIDEDPLEKEGELLIQLCNVPIYDSPESWSAKELSGVTSCYLNPNQLTKWKVNRVPVVLTNDLSKTTVYADFSDLHYMNPELYIAEPLYLSASYEDPYIVGSVASSYKSKTNLAQKFLVKRGQTSSNRFEKMHFTFHYLYKYTYSGSHYENGERKHIEPYSSQIYAVCQACQFLNESVFSFGDKKGCILQVSTGEGKSFIIQALAQALAREGKTIHIATSNIILAARDFKNGFKFFVQAEKKSKLLSSKNASITTFPTILLHQDERDRYLGDFLTESNDMPEKDKLMFYGDDAFNNSTNLNVSTCKGAGKLSSNIVFSTFLNFEAFYLSEKERNPNFIQDYYKNCILIIDEADSMLIDELPNGTILSKPMHSNGLKILEWVYEEYHDKHNTNAESILSNIKEMYPECTDLSINDVNRMFSDIDKVHDKDFHRKKKYVIKNIDNELRVVPIDLEHKGIQEPNKEFNGFIQQFIGIKEKRNPKYKDLVIQPISMNYMFISHPIYVKLYRGVIGLTGTVGNERDEKIFKDYYRLDIMKIPRNRMNLRFDLPMVLCSTTEERNNSICEEILYLHDLSYPILVVFKNLEDISMMKNRLIQHGVESSKIFVFNGTGNSENNQNKIEENSGNSGNITIGTNFCGRGISINFIEKPLHVIVTYYHDDKRAVDQVLGRAGRNGFPGTTRIICLKNEYYYESSKTIEESTKSLLDDFTIKNQRQLNFINDLQSAYPWAFDESKANRRITKSELNSLNSTDLNVSRITAITFKFPLCMTYATFLKLQAQRIYSIKNCPECEYTWNLFKRYIREMIFESWSIFLNDVDNTYTDDMDYNKHFEDKYALYKEELSIYLPCNGLRKDIIETFIFIHDLVVRNNQKYYDTLIAIMKQKSDNLEPDNKSTAVFKLGHFPLELKERSGIKFSHATIYDKSNSNSYKYIIDPELLYIKKDTDQREKKYFSITKIIDNIFAGIINTIDNKLTDLCAIRFFLRRTLRGCEFGIYIPNIDDEKAKPPNNLFDNNSILMFSITTKSEALWLAGILIVLGIFIAGVAIWIFNDIINPAKALKQITPILLTFLKSFFLGKVEETYTPGLFATTAIGLLDKIIEFLDRKIKENLNDSGIFAYEFLEQFLKIDTNSLEEKVNEKIYSKIKISDELKSELIKQTPIGRLVKIGVLLIVLIAQFIGTFKNHRAIGLDSYARHKSEKFKKEQKKHSDSLSIDQYDVYKSIEKDMKGII